MSAGAPPDLLGESLPEDAIAEAYKTSMGTMYQGKVEAFLDSPISKKVRGKVNLIFTSPPFPLMSTSPNSRHLVRSYLSKAA